MHNTTTLLRQNGIKVTPQRIAIVELMHHMGHISIEELYAQIKEKFPSISLATLYKNINAMLENAFVKEVKIVGHKSRFELAKVAHAHVICQKCGKVEDVHIDTQSFVQTIEKETAYRLSESEFQFIGICKACQ